MHDDGERVHGLAGNQDVKLHHGRNAAARKMIVERGVAARRRFQAVVEIQNDFVERQFVQQQHPARADILELLLNPALFFQQLQYLADIFFARDDGCINDRLFHLLDGGGLRELLRIIYLDDFASGSRNAIANTRRGGNQVDLEFALEALLHYVKGQRAEKTAAETEAERHGVFGLEAEGAVVEAQFFEGVTQQAVLVRLNRVQAGEDHGLDLLKSGQGFIGGSAIVRDRVTDLRVGDGLDVGEQETGFAGGQLIGGNRLRRLVPDAVHFIAPAVRP